MREQMPKLTKKLIDALKEPGRYGDGNGLYLLVGPTGAKSWVLRIVAGDRRRDFGLGSCRDVTLAEARELAAETRKQVRAGVDPVAERKKAAGIPTFEEAARKVHAIIRPNWREGVHVKHWIASLENDAFPKIGARSVCDVTSADVLSVLTPIWFEKPETARRVRQRLRQVMQWAKGAGYYEGENPVDAAAGSLPRHTTQQTRHHTALPFAEVPAFMAHLQERDGVAARALAFTILTAARSGEIRGARWEEVDLGNAVWTIPAARMKMKRDHRVPLSPDAVRVARSMEGFDEDLVFPGHKRGRPMSDMTLAAVLKRMKVEATVHGFRSAFRDWAAERTNFPREVAEHALAHSVGNAVERAYARSDLFEKRREMMETWARFCLPRVADVVELRA
ncbi:MAG: integrase arm-type DNA-binding domain-containing protein [Pseudomonadota bacterium]